MHRNTHVGHATPAPAGQSYSPSQPPPPSYVGENREGEKKSGGRKGRKGEERIGYTKLLDFPSTCRKTEIKACRFARVGNSDSSDAAIISEAVSQSLIIIVISYRDKRCYSLGDAAGKLMTSVTTSSSTSNSSQYRHHHANCQPTCSLQSVN